MVTERQDIKLFKGTKNDENAKQIPIDYFHKIVNYNYPDTGILGLDKILMPTRSATSPFDTADIDGMYEYRYLDDSNVLQTKYIVVNNGHIWSWDLTTAATSLVANLTAGKVSFTVFNDNLYITNGVDNIKVYDGALGIVSEMGAPFAVEGIVGNLGIGGGTYVWAVTYTTAGGEEVLGSISNQLTVSSKRVNLTLPIGYEGTISRSIYRNDKDDITTLKKVADIADNTTLTYTDNTADVNLGGDIPATNNALPKPYFLSVAGQKLFGIKTSLYPTQVFVSGTNNAVFDLASYIDVSNYADRDNTQIAGGGVDYNKVVVGSGKNIFLIDPIDNSCVITRANVGIKNGYTVQSVPANGDFPGGLMFVSTENDVRLMSGQQELIPMTLNNVVTVNWGQNIRGDLDSAFTGTITSICSVFYKYKYHLVINDYKYVFDIRTQGWTEHYIKSETTPYTSSPNVLAVMNNYLYNGQVGTGWCEREYASQTYRGENVEAFIQSGYIGVDKNYKVIEGMLLWFIPSTLNEINLTVVTDDNRVFKETQTFSVLAHSDFNVQGGAYSADYFSKNYYDVDLTGLDYRKININKTCRWFFWTMSQTTGNISLQGVSYLGQALANKESKGGQ